MNLPINNSIKNKQSNKMEELQCAACLRKTSYLLAKKIGKYFFCEKCFPTNAANTMPNNQQINSLT